MKADQTRKAVALVEEWRALRGGAAGHSPPKIGRGQICFEGSRVDVLFGALMRERRDVIEAALADLGVDLSDEKAKKLTDASNDAPEPEEPTHA